METPMDSGKVKKELAAAIDLHIKNKKWGKLILEIGFKGGGITDVEVKTVDKLK
jgi:hypothetical protein